MVKALSQTVYQKACGFFPESSFSAVTYLEKLLLIKSASIAANAQILSRRT